MKFRGIIFDLDGTLVHTKPEYRYNVVGAVLKEFGIKPVKKYIDCFWFETNRQEIIQKNFGIEPDIFWEKFQKLENIAFREKSTRAYSDTSAIENLKEKGMKLGIVTGSPRHILEMELAFIGKGLFDSIVPSRFEHGSFPKPNPHALEKCISELGLEKKEVAFAGNSEEDILTAKNADVYSILVDRKEHSFKYSKKPDLTIASLKELEKICGVD